MLIGGGFNPSPRPTPQITLAFTSFFLSAPHRTAPMTDFVHPKVSVHAGSKGVFILLLDFQKLNGKTLYVYRA